MCSDVECSLTHAAIEQYTSADGRTWRVTDAFLEEIDSDLQRIVNCTEEGDVVSFDVTGVVQPSSRVTVPWRLTFATHVDAVDSNGVAIEPPKRKTRFTCPQENTGLFVVQ